MDGRPVETKPVAKKAAAKPVTARAAKKPVRRA